MYLSRTVIPSAASRVSLMRQHDMSRTELSASGHVTLGPVTLRSATVQEYHVCK